MTVERKDKLRSKVSPLRRDTDFWFNHKLEGTLDRVQRIKDMSKYGVRIKKEGNFLSITVNNWCIETLYLKTDGVSDKARDMLNVVLHTLKIAQANQDILQPKSC